MDNHKSKQSNLLSIDPGVSEYFENAIPEHRKILFKLRDIILGTELEISEAFKWRVPFYAPVCYLSSGKRKVTMGFLWGAALFDPERQLQGSGENMRHLYFQSIADINQQLIVRFLEESQELYQTVSKQKNNASLKHEAEDKECC